MSPSYESLVGKLLVIGFPGTKVTPEIIQQFKDTHAGGVIFYRINYESPEQIRTLISDLESALERRLLVCVDHEGGRVIMYGGGVTVFPDNLTFGHAGKVSYAQKMGMIAAKELRAMGTDVNFAPVLDVLTESYSPNIGIRSFGMDHQTVAEMGTAYITALQQGGVSATAKHFPGKGHAPVDAHLKLPRINSTWKEMRETHLQPFIKAIAAGVDVVMSSHPHYPKLDPAPNTIATFSRRIITDCLRTELGFKGVISSDDLEMGAIKDISPIDQAAVKCVAAGHDLVLSCHDYESQRQVFKGLLEAVKNKTLQAEDLEASAERIETLKSKRPQRFEGDLGPLKEGPRLAAQISLEGVKFLQNPHKRIPLSSTFKKKTKIFFPQLSFFAQKIMVEEEFWDEKKFFNDHYGSEILADQLEIYPINPEAEEIKHLLSPIKEDQPVVFFCYDAHLHPAQHALLKAIQKQTKNFVLVLMRDPYDKSYLRPDDAALTAFGWRGCQVHAVLKELGYQDEKPV